MNCPFCKHDPFHYEDVGLGYGRSVPVAVVCCELGADFYSRDEKRNKFAWKILQLMRSYSPRKKARAMKILKEYGLK